MAHPGRPPKHKPSEDPCYLWARSLDPYVCFVGAFLRQVVTDAGSETEIVQREAQAFLWDVNRLATWIELTGADVDKMRGVLLQAAGLTTCVCGPSVRQQGESRSAAAPPRPQ